MSGGSLAAESFEDPGTDERGGWEVFGSGDALDLGSSSALSRTEYTFRRFGRRPVVPAGQASSLICSYSSGSFPTSPGQSS
jgi:hypothetical protein